MITFQDYMIEAMKYYREHQPSVRWGQAFMNALHEHNPELCVEVTGTDIDPFYEEGLKNIPIFDQFIKWVEENWKDEPKLRKFRFHWRDGMSNEGEGTDVADAFRRLGYGGGAIAALDYYEEI